VRHRRAFTSLLLPTLVAAGLAWPLLAETPTAKPEEVGLSAERLKRVTDLMHRHIDARTFSGAVTLVARRGRVAHFETQVANLEQRGAIRNDFETAVMQAVVDP
jgi:hypothetical protein